MADRKKSNFPGTTTISSGAYLDFFVGGVNYKISKADFIAALGATGTLVQDGNTLGTPVLDIQGDVNNIRNLENGPGVKASVSAENGITIEHNFLFDDSGVELVEDPTIEQPVFRSLVPGTGIGISGAGNEIQISLTGVPASTKTVQVSQLSDLPTAVSGVITLLDNTEYLFIDDVDIGTDRLVMGANTAVKGTESILITLTYSGTGDMFTMTNTTNRIANIALDAGANGRVLNYSDSSGVIFRMNDVTIVNCDKFGLFSGTNGVLRFTNVSPAAIATDGLEFTGNFRSFLWEVSASTISGGSLFNLGTATFDSFIVSTIIATINSGATFLSGAASSANINAGGSGLITILRAGGPGTLLSGITTDDALWEFLANDDIADTRPDGLLSMQGNATNTIIAVAGTPVLVAGAWAVELESQMTGTTGGRLTYNGGKDAKLPITGSVSVEPVSGTNIQLSAYIAINGVAIANSKRTASASSGQPSSITLPWQAVLSNGDYVEIWVANEDNTTNVLVSSAIHRIN